jgi:hypothetical protein
MIKKAYDSLTTTYERTTDVHALADDIFSQVSLPASCCAPHAAPDVLLALHRRICDDALHLSPPLNELIKTVKAELTMTQHMEKMLSDMKEKVMHPPGPPMKKDEWDRRCAEIVRFAQNFDRAWDDTTSNAWQTFRAANPLAKRSLLFAQLHDGWKSMSVAQLHSLCADLVMLWRESRVPCQFDASAFPASLCDVLYAIAHSAERLHSHDVVD